MIFKFQWLPHTAGPSTNKAAFQPAFVFFSSEKIHTPARNDNQYQPMSGGQQ